MTLPQTPRSASPGLQWAEKLASIGIFAFVLFQLYQSSKVGTTPRGTPAREALQHLHISVGLTLLVLVLIRLWLWRRLPRPAPHPHMPYASDALARACTLAFYLTVLTLCITGPLFAWSEGHVVRWFDFLTIPAPYGASYRASVTLGYLHSAIGFWIFLLAAFSVLVALWQVVRYRAAPWRMLPAFPWSPGAATASPGASGTASYPAPTRLLHGLTFVAMLAIAAWMPYRIFGVVPLTTGKQLVESGPPPVVDPYADIGASPELEGKTQKDFMWCRFCHSFEANGPHGVGPNLHRVFGRRAASAPGFYYSEAFVEAGKAGLVWDDAKVAELIGDPAKFLAGQHRMRYAPITDPKERALIVEALKAATK